MTNPALYSAILANPADDAPRLAYAKWLKEKGDKDRADFIKVQIDRAAKDRFDPAQERLEKKEKALLKKHETKWLADLPEWLLIRWFRRGFPAVACTDLEVLAPKMADAVKLVPLQGIELMSGGANAKGVKALAKCPQAAQFTELNICYNEVKDSGVKGIAASPHFANLKKLQLSSIGMTAAGVKALAESPHLSGLTDIWLDLDSDGLKALLSSKWKPTRLMIHGVPLTGAAMTALAKWEGLASVVELGIGSCEIGPEESKALAASPHLRNLKVLEIPHNQFTADGIKAIAGAPWLPQLVELHIQNSGLSDDVGRDIVTWPPLPNLKRLVSVNNQFSGDTTHALIKRYGNT